MSITNTVRENMKLALKSGNREAKQVYSSILNALNNKAKELLVPELTDEQAVEVVTKLVKQNKESIETCPSDRKEIIEKLEFERNILLQFLPKQMSESDIHSVIKQVLSDLGLNDPSVKDKGIIMKSLMPKTKGKADGKLVNTILSEYLSK